MTKTLACVSPIDGSVFATRPTQDRAEVEAILDRVRLGQKAWARRPLRERIDLVRAGIAVLGAMNDEVTVELAHMMGRPVRYKGEFGGVDERTQYMASIAAKSLEPAVVERSDAFHRHLTREPHGVVFVVAPWNYPYLTAINTIVPALIAGNAVVIKHATQTLLVGERIVRAFREAGMPRDVFVNLFLDHQTTEALIAAGRFDFINFTGSVNGGKAIERAAAGTFTPLGLELGGKDPGYVAEDADLDWAVSVLMDAAMYNSGQCCCGIERIYVHENLFDEFVERAVAWTHRLKLGNPLDPQTTLGPMASARFASEVRAQTGEAIAAGATPLVDRQRFPEDDGGTYVMPQVLVNVDHSMRVMMEESFGPVVGIMKVSGDDEAIALMNDSRYGLTVSLWTSDPDGAGRIGAAVATGTVFQNRADYLDPALCWTGCKDTGRGGTLGAIGFLNLTRPKSYHLRQKA
ncbi:MAG: aldehyde dehydrogenase family protein [Alphaproteobacteria bacterium]|nr:aldehyde dehydrogenase family protein [Alphaproteobacteria bacterium]